MKEYIMEKRFDNDILNGLVSVLIVMIVASIGWIVWSQGFNLLFKIIAGDSLKTIDSSLQDLFLLNAVEGSFFWLVISSWVWFSLDLGNYGKYAKTSKQPQAGFRYFLLSLAAGFVGFIIFVGLHGIWWEPFKWKVLFTPQTNVEAALAIKGWGAINFFALSVIMAQIPIVSLFQRYPFSKYSKSDWSIGFGTLGLSFFIALLNWNTFILPSFIQLQTNVQVAGQEILVLATQQPFGSWSTALAWAQIFIFFFLLPAEGGELYPQKIFTDKQPYSGMVGLLIALIGAFTLLPLLRSILAPLATSVNLDNDLVVASFVLTIINVLLTWHHLFYDYPSSDKARLGKRLSMRLITVLVVGSILGIVWIKYHHLIPFGSNDLGLKHPMLGLMGGQFVYMMPMLIMNTFFDKWPNAQSKLKNQ
ncbi:hypothetical protein ERUR111494_04625 [Erysipelothrix urinaevulpis]|uniref:hypothetical protein n=1 Tax=Erysipelothrix urinaevulpis TaxID=2683717 RepID=UPI001358EDFE|nr:hypothetical protein [Erysipelothrix urinaevulpis]